MACHQSIGNIERKRNVEICFTCKAGYFGSIAKGHTWEIYVQEFSRRFRTYLLPKKTMRPIAQEQLSSKCWQPDRKLFAIACSSANSQICQILFAARAPIFAQQMLDTGSILFHEWSNWTIYVQK
jgi:hypothetical protein